MKEFLVFTALRVGMFVGTFVILAGLWSLLPADLQVSVVWLVIASFVISGIASYRVLNRQREALAHHVQRRADQASVRFDRLRAKEDTPD
ncbi:MAG: DUF4229 domain-containing protein [Nocardioides sp.]